VNRQIYQWNRLESIEIEPHKGSKLMLHKGAEAIYNGAKKVFLANDAGTNKH
jgi:hypothetical protein